MPTGRGTGIESGDPCPIRGPGPSTPPSTSSSALELLARSRASIVRGPSKVPGSGGGGRPAAREGDSGTVKRAGGGAAEFPSRPHRRGRDRRGGSAGPRGGATSPRNRPPRGGWPTPGGTWAMPVAIFRPPSQDRPWGARTPFPVAGASPTTAGGVCTTTLRALPDRHGRAAASADRHDPTSLSRLPRLRHRDSLRPPAPRSSRRIPRIARAAALAPDSRRDVEPGPSGFEASPTPPQTRR